MKRIAVDPDSDLGRLLDEAAAEPLLLEKSGVRFLLSIEPPLRRGGVNPEATIEAMRAAAGSWQDIDAEAFKTLLYRAREGGTKREGTS